MALSGIFVSVNSVFGTLLRVKKKIRTLLAVSIITAVIILGTGWFLLSTSNAGLKEIGIVYLAGQAITSVIYLVMSGVGRIRKKKTIR